MPRKKTDENASPPLMLRWLDEEFRHGPLPEGPRTKWERLSNSERCFILWCKARGVALTRLAKAVGWGRDVVAHALEAAHDDPGIFAEVNFVVHKHVGRGNYLWFCRYCGDWYSTKAGACHHAHAHLWPLDPLQPAPRAPTATGSRISVDVLHSQGWGVADG